MGSGPLLPGGLQEAQEILGVYGLERRAAEVPGPDHLAEPGLAHPRDHDLGALGLLETGQQFAVDQLGLAVLQAVVLAIDGQHGKRSPLLENSRGRPPTDRPRNPSGKPDYFFKLVQILL
jgi:hypothetical protein